MRVLLAIDGSEQSNHAAEAVQCLTSVEHLTALHVLDLPRLTYPMLGPDIAEDLAMTVEQAMRAEGEKVMKHTMAHLSYHAAPVVKRLEEGVPADMILSIAQEIHADLILMGARGRGHVEELVLGSVSHKVLTKAPCSVLIIKSPVTEMKNILLLLQDLKDVTKIKRMLAHRPFPVDAKMTAFTVVPIPRSLFRAGVSASESKMQHALESAETFLDQAVDQLNSSSYFVTGLVGMGSPAVTILEQEAETQPDLMVMGIHHPSTVSQVLLGSVSHTVIHKSSTPILLLR